MRFLIKWRVSPATVRDNEHMGTEHDKPERGHAMKRSISTALVFAFALFLSSCGGSSDTSSVEEEGRIISGTLDAGISAIAAKAAEESGSCIDSVCAVVAYSANGSPTRGEIDPAQNRFRIRVRAGNWVFGFEDGDGNRLGYLAMNGITAFTVEDGDDVEIGMVRLQDGQATNEADLLGLGSNGLYSYYGRDADRDGLPMEFDADDPAFDPNSFDVMMIQPYDGRIHVAPCRSVKVAFTKEIDESSVTPDSVRVTLEDGTPVDGTLSVWEDAEYDEHVVSFTPANGYPLGSAIGVSIISGADGVLSAEGEELSDDVETAFFVRDFGGTGQTCHDPDQEQRQIRTQQREQVRLGGEGGGNGGGRQD